ncbi:Polyadenylate-binding protein 4 [Sorochytrium milnesiophthora]
MAKNRAAAASTAAPAAANGQEQKTQKKGKNSKKRTAEQAAKPESSAEATPETTPEVTPESSPNKKQKTASVSTASVYVQGLPANTTNDTLAKFFAKFGEIKHTRAKIVNKTCKGWAHIDFAKPESAAKAIAQANGATFEGKTLAVRASDNPSEAVSIILSNVGNDFKPTDVEDFFKTKSIESQRVQKLEEGLFYTKVPSHMVEAVFKLNGTKINNKAQPIKVFKSDKGALVDR